MARPSSADSGSALLVSAVAGAVLGAAGLAWWLLSEAERRRLSDADGADDTSSVDVQLRSGDRDLHDKVHELNQAIDDVRRQLESMGSR